MKQVFDTDYGSGKVTYIETGLVFELSIADQLNYLREDLLQVSFSRTGYIVDVGWYPDGDESGEFVVQVVEEDDWASSVYKNMTRDLLQLRVFLDRAIKIAEIHA